MYGFFGGRKQGHYNLIAREEEREMIPFCEDQGIALTPYSPLASGRLCRPAGETTKRLELDAYARFKYDKSQDADASIIERVKELAESKNIGILLSCKPACKGRKDIKDSKRIFGVFFAF